MMLYRYDFVETLVEFKVEILPDFVCIIQFVYDGGNVKCSKPIYLFFLVFYVYVERIELLLDFIWPLRSYRLHLLTNLMQGLLPRSRPKIV